jgi:hypothetical protein
MDTDEMMARGLIEKGGVWHMRDTFSLRNENATAGK